MLLTLIILFGFFILLGLMKSMNIYEGNSNMDSSNAGGGIPSGSGSSTGGTSTQAVANITKTTKPALKG
jgi:hypothetical protein